MRLVSKIIFVLIIVNGATTLASAPTIPVVMTEIAKLSDLSDSLSYPARIESKVNSLIYSESDGVVSKILAPLGAQVKRGAKLAIIKHTDPVYQYAPLTLISQVNGIVSQVPVTEGSTINKGALVIAVTDPVHLQVTIEIAASDLQSFKEGMEGTFQVSGSTDLTKVKVKGVSPAVDPASGTARCELKLLEKDIETKLPPGTVGQVHFSINAHRGFVFPDSAVVYRGDATFVRIVKDGIATKVPVILGRHERGRIEILKGVKDGDQVVDRTSQFIADGDKVQVEASDGAKGG